MSFYSLTNNKSFEVSVWTQNPREPARDFAEISFGETRHGAWPDFFTEIRIAAFRSELVEAFQREGITGAEWRPVKIAENRNRRLISLKPPSYRQLIVTGKIQTAPYYTKTLSPEKRTPSNGQRGWIGTEVKWIEVSEPVELSDDGTRIRSHPNHLKFGLEHFILCHRILPKTWDGSDIMDIFPRVSPYTLYSQKFVDLLARLAVRDCNINPLRPGNGIDHSDTMMSNHLASDEPTTKTQPEPAVAKKADTRTKPITQVSRKRSPASPLPPFKLTELGWLATLPAEQGTFLGQPINLEINLTNSKKPDASISRQAKRILRDLPMILETAESALREQIGEDQDMWPRRPDPTMVFGDPGDDDEWVFCIEAIDNEGASWDLVFNGTELIDIYPAIP